LTVVDCRRCEGAVAARSARIILTLMLASTASCGSSDQRQPKLVVESTSQHSNSSPQKVASAGDYHSARPTGTESEGNSIGSVSPCASECDANSPTISDAVKPPDSSEPLPSGSDQGPVLPLPEERFRSIEVPGSSNGTAFADRIARLAPWQCRAELKRRKLAVNGPGMPAVGVATPIRLSGSVGSVHLVSPGAKSVYGILDCRMALLLLELSPLLATLSIRDIYVDNFYRPKAHLPGKKSPSQHAFGLAIDIDSFKLLDGTVLKVERDFHGEIGAPVCGQAASVSPPTREAILLRNIVCELAKVGAFSYFLTPNHDEAHRNHLHGDIKRGAREHVLR